MGMVKSRSQWELYFRDTLRVMSALLFIEHGTGKLFHFPAFAAYQAVTWGSLAGAAGFIELIGGSLLLFGLATRVVAFVMAGEMAIAYFTFHAPRSFYPLQNGGEPAILFCFIFLYLAAAGNGRFALDLNFKRSDRSRVENA